MRTVFAVLLLCVMAVACFAASPPGVAAGHSITMTQHDVAHSAVTTGVQSAAVQSQDLSATPSALPALNTAIGATASTDQCAAMGSDPAQAPANDQAEFAPDENLRVQPEARITGAVGPRTVWRN